MALMKGSQELQPERAHILNKGLPIEVVFAATSRIDGWSVSIYYAEEVGHG